VVLDPLAECNEFGDFAFVEHAGFPLVGRYLLLYRLAGFGVLRIHRLLLGEGDFLDLAGAAIDDVVIGRDRPRDHSLAEPPGGLDDQLRVARRGVTRKQYTRLLGVDHPLDDDRDVDALVIEALLFAVVDRALGKQRRPALLHFLQEVLAGDIEKGLLLAGETRVGQVLGGRRRPDRDERLAVVQIGVGGGDLLAEFGGHLSTQDEVPSSGLGVRERRRVLRIDVDGVEQFGIDARLLDERPIRFRADDEPRRYGQIRRLEFPEGGTLPANSVDVLFPHVVEPEYGHRWSVVRKSGKEDSDIDVGRPRLPCQCEGHVPVERL
jgi:hypothetical protein